MCTCDLVPGVANVGSQGMAAGTCGGGQMLCILLCEVSSCSYSSHPRRTHHSDVMQACASADNKDKMLAVSTCRHLLHRFHSIRRRCQVHSPSGVHRLCSASYIYQRTPYNASWTFHLQTSSLTRHFTEKTTIRCQDDKTASKHCQACRLF